MVFFRVNGAGRRLVATLVSLLLVAGAAGCAQAGKGSGSSKQQETPTLSASKAGEKYLAAVCPVNHAWEMAEVEIDALRLQVSRGETSTERIEQVFAGLKSKLTEAREALTSTTEKWPKKASALVAEVADTLQQDITQLTSLAKLSADKIASYAWQGGEQAAAAAQSAREALGITGTAQESCKAWHDKQKAEEEAAQSKSGKSGNKGEGSGSESSESSEKKSGATGD